MEISDTKKRNIAIVVLSILAIFFMFRSCSNSRKERRAINTCKSIVIERDSLKNEIHKKTLIIDGFPETLRQSALKIHLEYDMEISKRDRSPQLMDLHINFNKPKIKELQINE